MGWEWFSWQQVIIIIKNNRINEANCQLNLEHLGGVFDYCSEWIQRLVVRMQTKQKSTLKYLITWNDLNATHEIRTNAQYMNKCNRIECKNFTYNFLER